MRHALISVTADMLSATTAEIEIDNGATEAANRNTRARPWQLDVGTMLLKPFATIIRTSPHPTSRCT
jgi:hypothetical protein